MRLLSALPGGCFLHVLRISPLPAGGCAGAAGGAGRSQARRPEAGRGAAGSRGGPREAGGRGEDRQLLLQLLPF